MKFINFYVVKFALFLTAGILVAHFYPSHASLQIYIFIGLLSLLVLAWFVARKQLFQNIAFGIITYACFFCLGYVSYQLRLPEFQKNHYSKFLNNKDTSTFKNKLYQLKIKEVLKPDTFNFKYLAKIIAQNNIDVTGKILLTIKKDTLSSPLTIDDVLLVSGTLQNITTPLNPHQFNYATYMKTLGAYHKLRITNNVILQKIKGKQTLRGKAENIRNYIIKKLKKSPISPNQLSIMQALILGQRKDINKKMYSDYASAGAIHILAVSGLHVGIVYFIILLLLSPLKSFPKGRVLISVLTVIFLWGFAFITGLSPSVIRAVTMFSFFAFAKIINRETNSLNTLFLSYFMLLLINPMWLFHVGFQLSYLAVFFILWILPLFNKAYYPKNYVGKKLWAVFTVTIAAQLGIIPLSLYYFHQFPGLFLITNIVVLPFLGILLGSGILIIVLAVLNILPNWLAAIYDSIIKLLNYFINWVASQEIFLFQDIHFSGEKALGSYLLIIALVFLWKRRNFRRTSFALLAFALLIVVFIFDNYHNSKNQLIVFHKNRKSIVGYMNGDNFQLFRSDTTMSFKDTYPVKGYRIANSITTYSEKKLPSIFSYKRKKILILDSLGIYPKVSGIDIVLLSLSPKINLERLIDSLHPKLIIADGSNYTSYVSRWQKTCNKKKLPFHFTGTDGAFIISE